MDYEAVKKKFEEDYAKWQAEQAAYQAYAQQNPGLLNTGDYSGAPAVSSQPYLPTFTPAGYNVFQGSLGPEILPYLSSDAWQYSPKTLDKDGFDSGTWAMSPEGKLVKIAGNGQYVTATGKPESDAHGVNQIFPQVDSEAFAGPEIGFLQDMQAGKIKDPYTGGYYSDKTKQFLNAVNNQNYPKQGGPNAIFGQIVPLATKALITYLTAGAGAAGLGLGAAAGGAVGGAAAGGALNLPQGLNGNMGAVLQGAAGGAVGGGLAGASGGLNWATQAPGAIGTMPAADPSGGGIESGYGFNGQIGEPTGYGGGIESGYGFDGQIGDSSSILNTDNLKLLKKLYDTAKLVSGGSNATGATGTIGSSGDMGGGLLTPSIVADPAYLKKKPTIEVKEKEKKTWKDYLMESLLSQRLGGYLA